MKLRLTFSALLAACMMLVNATNVFAEAIDVRFTNPTATGCSSPTQFCITLQVKAGTGSNVKIANSTVFFTYNAGSVASPAVTVHNFSTGTTPPTGDGYGYAPQFQALETGTTGEGNYNIIYGAAGESGSSPITELLNTSTWTDAATFCFTVVNAAQTPNIAINTTYSGFNKSTNSPIDVHTLGTLTGYNGPICAAASLGAVVSLKVLLQGPTYAAATGMANGLSAILPLTHPYTAAPYLATTTATAALTSIPTDMVDWVYVEAATLSGTTYTVVERRVGILQRDGDIIDPAGSTSGLTFTTLTTGSSYYFIVKHRCHLPVRSANLVTISGAGTAAYDFTNSDQLVGTTIQQRFNTTASKYFMYVGELTNNSTVTGQDINSCKNANTQTGYRNQDVNMNGTVTGQDVNLCKSNNTITVLTLPY